MSHEEAHTIETVLSNPKAIPTRLPRCRLPTFDKYSTGGPISQGRYVPAAHSGSASGTTQSQPPANTDLNPAIPAGSSSQQGTANANIPLTSIATQDTLQLKSWILLGVQGFHKPLEIKHIEIKDDMNDSKFYREVKASYKKGRGRLKRYLSIWTFSYCEAVKVRT